MLERRSGVSAEIAVHAIVLAYRRGDKESDFSALNGIRYYRFTRIYMRIEIARYRRYIVFIFTFADGCFSANYFVALLLSPSLCHNLNLQMIFLLNVSRTDHYSR